jgi:hypothetical protein
VVCFFMALLSFRGISTPSLLAQGEQRRSTYFNIPKGNSPNRFSMYDTIKLLEITKRGSGIYSQACWSAPIGSISVPSRW